MAIVEPLAAKLGIAPAQSKNADATTKHLFFVSSREDEIVCQAVSAELLTNGMRLHALPVNNPEGTVEQLALKHIEVIRRLQPIGPYRVAGSGWAGLVAYEIAFRLLGEDEDVEFLCLINSPRPKNEPRASAAVDPGRNIDYESYCPQVLPIPIHLFAAEPSRAELCRDWSALAGSRLMIEAIESEASWEPDTARRIAQVLRARREVQERSVPSRREHSSILPIQTGSRGAVPIYCVPGAGANVTSLMPLAEAFGQDVAVVGLQPRGMDGMLVPHTSVAAAARAYVGEMLRASQSPGFQLLGHSFGGWVVFEMSRLLLEAGRSVQSLVLIDTQPPSRGEARSRHHGRLDVLLQLVRLMEQASERDLCLSRSDLEKLSYEAQLSTLTDRMKSAGLLPVAARVDAIRSLVRVFSVNVNTSYAPTQNYPGEMLFIRAAHPSGAEDSDSDERGDDEAVEAWSRYVRTLVPFASPGNHMTMLKAPNVESLASRIRVFLERADGRRMQSTELERRRTT